MEYRATVTGRRDPAPVDEVDLWTTAARAATASPTRSSPPRAPSSAGLDGRDLLAAVARWSRTRSSTCPARAPPTDGAVRTLLARHGVCRDYAHLVIALLRALDVPARLAAVYAPGLDPDGLPRGRRGVGRRRWHVVDATGLAPRPSLLRIATGRDASDTAFLTNTRSLVTISRMEVLATVDELPVDDVAAPVRLG